MQRLKNVGAGSADESGDPPEEGNFEDGDCDLARAESLTDVSPIPVSG